MRSNRTSQGKKFRFGCPGSDGRTSIGSTRRLDSKPYPMAVATKRLSTLVLIADSRLVPGRPVREKVAA